MSQRKHAQDAAARISRATTATPIRTGAPTTQPKAPNLGPQTRRRPAGSPDLPDKLARPGRYPPAA